LYSSALFIMGFIKLMVNKSTRLES